MSAARRHRVPLALRIGLTAALVAAVGWFILLPQLSDVEASVSALNELAPPLVVAAFALEALSLMSYSAVTGTVLGWRRLRFGRVLRIDLSDLAVNHTLPGGGATASAVRFRLLMSEGIGARDALGAATMEITLSNLVLTVIFVVGLGLSAGQLSAGPSNLVLAGIVVAIVVGGTAAAGWLLLHRADSLATIADRAGARIPFVGRRQLGAFVHSLARSLRALGRDRRRLAWAVTFAFGNWLLDAAALWMMLAAFGQPIGIGALLTVYGVASIIALLPLTPGGVGLVEGVTVPALIGFGVPHGSALLGVVGWRVFEYWLPIPVGGVAYLSLRMSRRRREHMPASTSIVPPPTKVETT